MAEQSHRDEMNAAIRAQRERHAAPRTIAPVDEAAVETLEAPPERADSPVPEAAATTPDAPAPPQAEPPPLAETAEPRKSLFDRLRGR
jgi:hypothetical protein